MYVKGNHSYDYFLFGGKKKKKLRDKKKKGKESHTHIQILVRMKVPLGEKKALICPIKEKHKNPIWKDDKGERNNKERPLIITSEEKIIDKEWK